MHYFPIGSGFGDERRKKPCREEQGFFSGKRKKEETELMKR